MTENIVPHFHNDIGVAEIEIGAKEFMCIGAMSPFDHPHVFCDMGDDKEYVCPYCSTLYRYNPALKPNEARPPECALKIEPVGPISDGTAVLAYCHHRGCGYWRAHRGAGAGAQWFSRACSRTGRTARRDRRWNPIVPQCHAHPDRSWTCRPVTAASGGAGGNTRA